MSENDKSNTEDISIKDISKRLEEIELKLSQNKESKQPLQSLRAIFKKILTRDNIEFAFSFLALVISVSVAIMILRQ